MTSRLITLGEMAEAFGDRAFIGSNAALVAPVRIGDDATTAAGSVIVSDVPDGKLAVARGRQSIVEGWTRPKKR